MDTTEQRHVSQLATERIAEGVPIKIDGEVVGGIGLSGESADQNRTIAEAGTGAL